MKKNQVMLAAVPAAIMMAMGVSAPAMAKDASTIVHCGCNYDGTDLEGKEITVNNTSCDHPGRGSGNKIRGHSAHDSGDEVYCTASGMTFVRTENDCRISGSGCDGMVTCTTFGDGDDCGNEVVP